MDREALRRTLTLASAFKDGDRAVGGVDDDRSRAEAQAALLATSLGDGWEVSLQDTFGELLTEIILRDGGASATADAAAGWGGDRVALIEGPGDGVAVVWDTAWDSQGDADEFEAALAPTIAELQATGRSASVLRKAIASLA